MRQEIKTRNLVHFEDLGNISYQEAWDLQESLLKINTGIKSASRSNKNYSPLTTATQHHLLFCEHPHVYTLGKSGKAENLLLQEEGLKSRGIEFFKINRGGDITYHGPGQITGYPIFDLEKFKTDINWYLRTMEEVMIRLLADYDIEGGRIAKETGVWLGVGTMNPRKICAFGVKASRWVTMHGFAFNVNTDLRYFSHIVPCGIADKGVTSLEKELGQKIDMEEVKEKLRNYFSEIFQFEFV